MPDDHSEGAPPDPMPNSAVKPLSADGSAALGRVRVGHRQALNTKPRLRKEAGFFIKRVVVSYWLEHGDPV